MLKKKEFLEKYHIKSSSFDSTQLKWEDLIATYDHYTGIRPQLEPIATFLVESLRRVAQVHSLKARTKDPEHLIEKIIRKRVDAPQREITIENYRQEITDLIGVRALHLFKEDWLAIHDSIMSTFSVEGEPVANIRAGDENLIIQTFNKNRWPVKEHKYGYRSIHYLISSQPGKQRYIAELQVRTIFEEGWSEIDHSTRYPYDLENPVLTQYLILFNRLAGSADEMGTFVKTLLDQLRNTADQHSAALAKKDELITALKAKIETLEIEQSKKKQLVADINTLSKSGLLSPEIAILPISLSGLTATEPDVSVASLFTNPTPFRIPTGGELVDSVSVGGKIHLSTPPKPTLTSRELRVSETVSSAREPKSTKAPAPGGTSKE